MTTYYVRNDGTATKAQALGPTSDAAACMSVATFNAASFDPGDEIRFSGLGGPITSSILPTSSGTPEAPIKYWGYPGVFGGGTLVDLSDTAVTTQALGCISLNDVDFGYFDLRGNSNDACWRVSGTAGAGRYGVKCRSVRVLGNTSPDGSAATDGFSQSDTSEVEYFDIYATKCQEAAKTGSNQALTLHVASRAIVRGFTVPGECNYAVVNTENTQCDIYDANIQGCAVTAIGLGTNATSAARLRVFDSTIIANVGGGLAGTATGGGKHSRIEFHNCDIVVSNSKPSYSQGTCVFYGCRIDWSAANSQFMAFGGGTIAVIDCVVKKTAAGAMFQCESNSMLYARGSEIVRTAGSVFRFNNSTSGGGAIRNNWVHDSTDTSAGTYVISIIAACASPPDVENNTVDGCHVFLSNLGSPAAFKFRHNILRNTTTPVSAPGAAVISANFRAGTTPDFGSDTIQRSIELVNGRCVDPALLGVSGALFRTSGRRWLPFTSYAGRN